MGDAGWLPWSAVGSSMRANKNTSTWPVPARSRGVIVADDTAGQWVNTSTSTSALVFLPLTELTLHNAELRHPGWAAYAHSTKTGVKMGCDCTHWCFSPRAFDAVLAKMED